MADFEIDLSGFKKQLDKFTKEELPKKLMEVQKKIVLMALRRVVEMTPVDTGRARGGWLVSINKPSSEKVEDFKEVQPEERLIINELEGGRKEAPLLNKTGDEVVKKGLAVLAGLRPMQVVWISNNVDYIEFLEEGHSQQAPAGMVAITVAKIQASLQEIS